MYYHDYLQLDKVLNAQSLVSEKETEKAHDEMLFIIIHQAYELWFKQIIFELDYVHQVFEKEKIDDNESDLNLVRHRLNRVSEIFELLNKQIEILYTMTPLDFMEFRNLLTPSSGFQSLQFRKIEAKLGLVMEKRHQANYYKRVNEGGFNVCQHAQIEAVENEISIATLINKWLERMPFFDKEYWTDYTPQFDNKNNSHLFWNDYAQLYSNALSEKEKEKFIDFENIFLNKITDNNDAISFSKKALQAGLFINLYRDIPVFQTSYQILDKLIEIDHQMATWRHKHLVMVRRMIGTRMGTGNTSGQGYLEGALQSHFIFKDLSGLATFIIERRKIPKLPISFIKKLGYSI